MNRVAAAFRAFFSLLFTGQLPEDIAVAFGFVPPPQQKSAPAPPPAINTGAGALQILGILQRDSRLIDFVMEDISSYSDDQVGSAVRSLHEALRDSLNRYIKLEPVIDGVEGTYVQAAKSDPGTVKFVGNVPAGAPAGGTLRHRGWRAGQYDLPPVRSEQESRLIFPAEIEIE